MSKQEKKGLMPELRFTEFREAGCWEEEPLGNKTNKIGSGITPRGGSENYKDKGRPFVRSQNIGWGNLILKDVVFIDDATHSTFSATEIEEGDVLLNITGASIGRSAVADPRIKGGNVNQHVCIIRAKPKKLNSFFLNQFLLSHNGQNQIDSFQAGGNREGLNFGQIRSFTLPLPPKVEEQQKIADCLTSINELVTTQTQKLDALKSHKKGLMQQLFPAEGETLPKLRFPEFRDAGEWDEARLGDKDISTFIKDRIPLEQIDIESYISTVNLLPDYAGVKTATTLPPSGSFTQFRKNDVLISNIRPYLKKVWQARMDGSASNDVIVIRAKNKIIDDFLIYILKNDDFINYVMKDAKGVKMPRGDISSMKKYPLYYPSKNEQQKIADCLISIDALIRVQAQKIESLKAHKKGLMQQLFPVMGEVDV